MTLTMAALLFGVGTLAGIINAVAGGGILFLLPVMLAAGVPPVSASASSSVAVLAGNAVPILADRTGPAGARDRLARRIAIAAAGGTIGALLLLASGDALFRGLVPWLILFATLAFAFGPRLANAIDRFGAGARPGAAAAFEFVVAVYGGYFGAGLGVLIMAALGLLGVSDIHLANWLKNAIATVITGLAVALYIVGGAVSWPETSLALAGGLIGGYIGARLAGTLSAHWLRRGVVGVGFGLSAYYFLH